MSQQMRNGYGFDFSVPVGQSMAVSSITGTYSATIVAGPGKGTALATDSTGGGTYGPYAGGVVIRLQAGENSLIDYDIAVSPALTYAGPLNSGYNSSGDVASAVDGAGSLVVTNLAISQLPNNTLSDTVTTQQQLAVATIPGGMFKADSILEVNMLGVATGSVSKTVGFKAGPASGTLASATAFGGTGGITSQGSVGIKALLWGNGVLGAQRATANGPINWAAAHSSTIVTLGIDTSLDWNIYVYVQFATSGSGDTFMVRPFWATWCR